MAFRLGYQISCNLNKNVLIRSASVGGSRRFQSLSPSCLYRQLKDNVIPNASLTTALSHQRCRLRLSSDSFGISPTIRTLQNYSTYRNFSRIRQDDQQEATEEVVLAQDNPTDKPYFNIVKLRKGPVTPTLQPKNINPVATADININSFTPYEEKNPHSEKFRNLRKQAHIKYLKAVRSLNKKENEDFPYRYKLEAANPKSASARVFSAVDLRRKLEQEVHNTIPQLQPKNIKPFGNITNIQWRVPNAEKAKQGYIECQNRNEGGSDTNKNFAVKQGDFERDVNENLSSMQQREYCTAQNANDTEKCSKPEYKRINSDYMEDDESFPAPSNPESKQPIDQSNATQLADESLQTEESKRQNSRYMLYMLGGSVYSKRVSEEPSTTIYKNNFKPLNETTIFHRLKTNTRPITVKIGPKWKLQSTGRPDIVESLGPLNPEPNEKFLVPWPSYAERVKTGKTPRLPKLVTPAKEVDESNNVIKDKYDVMYNKIRSDTNALSLKPQNALPELGSPSKQSTCVLSREYSTGLRRNEVGKEQGGFLKMRKSSDYYEVLSKISDIQEKRYASYKKGSSMKPLAKNKLRPKLKNLPKSEVPQIRMKVPNSDTMTKPPIIYHVGKAIKAKLSRETLFQHVRNQLKSQAGNQQARNDIDTLIKPHGGYMFSRQRALNYVPGKAPAMMFSTLTRIQPSRNQDISFRRSVYVPKTFRSSRVDENLRILRSYLRPVNVPDHPQVCDEGLLSQLKSNTLSKQNLNSTCSFIRSLTNLEEANANHASIFESIWAKVTEYFSFLNTFKVPRACFGCASERPVLGSDYLSPGRTTALYTVPSRNYSLSEKFEARRNRKREPCPCKIKKISMTEPGLRRLPKHPPMDRPPYKCELPCVDLGAHRADFLAHLEIKRKSLPVLVASDCPCPQHPKSDVPQPKLKRLPKFPFPEDRCVSVTVCEDQMDFRADKHLKIEKKTLPVLVPGKLPALEKQPPRPPSATFKRLPKAPFVDRPPYKCELPCVDLNLFRADRNLIVKPKTLPKLEFDDCPCPTHKKTDYPQPTLKRLPKPPIEDRVWDCRDVDDCAESEKLRADRGLTFSKRKRLPTLVPGTCPPEEDFVCPPNLKGKTKPSIFKNNNREFSTLANRAETVHGRRSFSTNSQKRNEPRECKKLVKSDKKQCKKLTLVKCEPAKSITCKKMIKKRMPCSKTNSPYPSFSECKDEDDAPPLTECDTRKRHLQPRWPILNEIETLKPPPPKQGKIDPSKEEICVMQKLNMTRSGTKTCDTFYAPEKSFNAKEMLAEHREEEDEDVDDCEESSEYPLTPEPTEEEKIPPKEDACEKRPKPKLADVCGASAKPDSPDVQQEKSTPKQVCSLPKHEKPCQAPAKAVQSQQRKLTPKDICDLTKKKVGAEPKKGFFGGGKSKAISKKKAPVKVAVPPKGFFQRLLEFFFGKPRRRKPLLSEQPKKNASSLLKPCKKGTTVKTKPVFCYTNASAGSKKKLKRKDLCKTSKSKAKPSKECEPKESPPKDATKTELCADIKSKEQKETKKPTHKITELTKASPCPDELKQPKKEAEVQKETKKPPHKIMEVTTASPCPDEHKETKKEASKSPESKKPKHKIAGITQASLCPDECDGREMVEEEDDDCTEPAAADDCKDKTEGGNAKSKQSPGRCRIPPYKDCPPRARQSCKKCIKRKKCKPNLPPYASFSECHKDFPRIPISECTEQERRKEQHDLEVLSKQQKE